MTILSDNGGSNTLTGGLGNDTLTGNAGDDVYVFNRGDGQDSVDNIDFLYDINDLCRPQASDTLRFTSKTRGAHHFRQIETIRVAA